MAFIKIQANQGTIGANQNLMDFEVPSYVSGVDMSESFIDIAYEITHDADTHGAGTTVLKHSTRRSVRINPEK